MNLLVINYEMSEESGVLAWQSRVVNALAVHCQQVVVLTERTGPVALRDNVYLEQIPRRPWRIPRSLGGAWVMNARVAALHRRYRFDACFIHMAMEWAYRLAPALRVLRIPTVLWYAHGTVTWRLRAALLGVNGIVTSSPEGFRIDTPKRHIIGQGIDLELFRPPERTPDRAEVLYCGRISPRKRIDLLLAAMAAIRHRFPDSPVRLRLVGPTLTPDDVRYDQELRTRVSRDGLQERVRFDGFVPMTCMPQLYRQAFLQLNVSQTGSMDKTVLEALACGCPALTSNPAFAAFFRDTGYPEFVLQDERPESIAERVVEFHANRDRYPVEDLRGLIRGRHDLDSYVRQVLEVLNGLR